MPDLSIYDWEDIRGALEDLLAHSLENEPKSYMFHASLETVLKLLPDLD